MRPVTGSQWSSMSSAVTCALFGWLNTRRAAAFWIICSGFTTQAGRPIRRVLLFFSPLLLSPLPLLSSLLFLSPLPLLPPSRSPTPPLSSPPTTLRLCVSCVLLSLSPSFEGYTSSLLCVCVCKCVCVCVCVCKCLLCLY